MTVTTRRKVDQDQDLQNRTLILKDRLAHINQELARIGLPGELRQKMEKDRRQINRSMTGIREECNHNLTHKDDGLIICSICYEIL